MTKLLIITSMLALLAASAGTAQSPDLIFAPGLTGESTWVLRTEVRVDVGQWYHSTAGVLLGYLDGAYTWWLGNDASDNHSLSLAPVFVYEFAAGSVRPFIEGGIGVAALEKSRVERRDLGSRYQFEDRIGVGMRLRRHEIGFRVTHYSNAGLKRPNQGVETYTLHYRLAM